MKVLGRVVRPKIGYSAFVDLTAVPVASGGIARDGVTFDGDLTPVEYDAVWARMTSLDDDDQSARADLRAADGATNLAEMVRAYVLGDALPLPVYPA